MESWAIVELLTEIICKHLGDEFVYSKRYLWIREVAIFSPLASSEIFTQRSLGCVVIYNITSFPPSLHPFAYNSPVSCRLPIIDVSNGAVRVGIVF